MDLIFVLVAGPIRPSSDTHGAVLIAEAGRVGLPLNVICVNAAMSVYARNGRWYEALDLLHKMREQQSLRNVRNIGSSRVGTSEEAEEASAHYKAEGMEQRPLTLPLPDAITYNVAIRGRWRITTMSCRVQHMVVVFHADCNWKLSRIIYRIVGAVDDCTRTNSRSSVTAVYCNIVHLRHYSSGKFPLLEIRFFPSAE